MEGVCELHRTAGEWDHVRDLITESERDAPHTYDRVCSSFAHESQTAVMIMHCTGPIQTLYHANADTDICVCCQHMYNIRPESLSVSRSQSWRTLIRSWLQTCCDKSDGIRGFQESETEGRMVRFRGTRMLLGWLDRSHVRLQTAAASSGCSIVSDTGCTLTLRPTGQ